MPGSKLDFRANARLKGVVWSKTPVRPFSYLGFAYFRFQSPDFEQTIPKPYSGPLATTCSFKIHPDPPSRQTSGISSRKLPLANFQTLHLANFQTLCGGKLSIDSNSVKLPGSQGRRTAASCKERPTRQRHRGKGVLEPSGSVLCCNNEGSNMQGAS